MYTVVHMFLHVKMFFFNVFLIADCVQCGGHGHPSLRLVQPSGSKHHRQRLMALTTKPGVFSKVYKP